MSILFRYVSREILTASLLALLALLGLFSFFDFISELGDTHATTYTPLSALVYVALYIPVRLYELMPVALLIGSLFAWNRLALASEFSVMRAAGLSMYRLVSWMLALGLGLGMLTLGLGEYLTPYSEQAAKQLKARATTGVVAREFRTGLWAKDGNTFINVRVMRPDASLLDLNLYVFDRDFHLRALRHAAQAVWADGRWTLRQVSETVIEPGRTRTVRLPEQTWESAITPDLLAVLMVTPDRMSISTLRAYVHHLRGNKQDAGRYEIALWNKVIYPVAAPVMLLLALAFAYRPPRSGGTGGRLLTGVLLGLGFHLLNRLLAQVTQLLDWSPPAAALTPVLMFAAAASMAIWWQERR
ncbi:MAG TPA: LPS export ABC transporter permease LptG [Thiobacillaceae bacterium]|nr:LPS export ABC transporter permease LptG [Thiobacillaceae bacterium]HNU64256.1 LPS export ABC transporter permease LptG [Thiobacillaceae bacterium]